MPLVLMKSPLIPHGRTHFYKYFDYQGIYATLEQGALRLSSPRHFNDPFDLRFTLKPPLTADDLIELFVERYIGAIRNGTPPPWPKGMLESQKTRATTYIRENLTAGKVIAHFESERPNLHRQFADKPSL